MDEHAVLVQGERVVEVLGRDGVDREGKLLAQVDPSVQRGLDRIERLEAAAFALLHEQRLEHGLDPVRPAENPLEPSPPAPAVDEREVARPRLAASLAVDDHRHARREVRLADEELAASGELYDERIAHALLGRRWWFGAGGDSATSTAPESSGQPAASGSGNNAWC